MEAVSARKHKSNEKLESKVLAWGLLGMQGCFLRVFNFVPLLNLKKSTNNKEETGQTKYFRIETRASMLPSLSHNVPMQLSRNCCCLATKLMASVK